jgi:hypothetical protein
VRIGAKRIDRRLHTSRNLGNKHSQGGFLVTPNEAKVLPVARKRLPSKVLGGHLARKQNSMASNPTQVVRETYRPIW